MLCLCGCDSSLKEGKRYVSGHNLVGMLKTEEHRKRIGEGQRKAWATKRKRLPLGATNHDADGYVRVKVVLGAGKWDKQHILAMEGMIGRKLLPGEMVHHINGIRADNNPRNLFLCASKSEHSKIEESCKTLVKNLVLSGLVLFNVEERRYELA